MSLHLLFVSPAGDALAQCRAALVAGDALLLLGDGVYAAMPGTRALAGIDPGIEIHALDEDCAARGVAALDPRVRSTDYAGFVALAAAHARSVSWF